MRAHISAQRGCFSINTRPLRGPGSSRGAATAASSSSIATAGAGRELVKAAVEWARTEDKRLLPLCPFARSVFDRTPEYRDVLAD